MNIITSLRIKELHQTMRSFKRHKWTILSHPTPSSARPVGVPRPPRVPPACTSGQAKAFQTAALWGRIWCVCRAKTTQFHVWKVEENQKTSVLQIRFMIFQTTILRISSAISDMKYGSLLESKVTCTCWNIYRYLPVYEYLLGNHPFWSFFCSRSGRIRRCLAMWFLQQKLRFRRLGQEWPVKWRSQRSHCNPVWLSRDFVGFNGI